jgi:transcriptional regulator with XRE-family HTH domain
VGGFLAIVKSSEWVKVQNTAVRKPMLCYCIANIMAQVNQKILLRSEIVIVLYNKQKGRFKLATVGDKIRQIREKRGLTQDQLCQKANISKGFLSDVENGKRNISSQKLLDVANVLGASIDYLLKDELIEEIQNASVTIPPELSEAAEQCGVTYAEILDVLAAQRSIVARRSTSKKKELSVEEWKKLFETIKGVFG